MQTQTNERPAQRRTRRSNLTTKPRDAYRARIIARRDAPITAPITAAPGTHEAYILAVRDIALARLDESERAAFHATAKLVYGAGSPQLRGVTYFKRWNAQQAPHACGTDCDHTAHAPGCVIEICAFGESDHVQLAATTIHEIAHWLAGYQAGHGKDWRAACKRLGLRIAHAAGQRYCLAYLDPDVRMQIAALATPSDGRPVSMHHAGGNHGVFGGIGLSPSGRPCGAGNGTRGGKSRGTGSGSRMLKVSCADCGCVIRMTRTWLDSAGAPTCGCGGTMDEA